MHGTLTEQSVNTLIAQASETWKRCAATAIPEGRRYDSAEQRGREQAYDAALDAVEVELTAGDLSSGQTQDRLIALFAEFSGAALGLEQPMTRMLTNEFIPVGVRLAQYARRFDPDLPMQDIIQASRNAWTACGLQPLLGVPIRITGSILGYSLLYPYSDNYLDDESLTTAEKLRFSSRFRQLLQGETLSDPEEHEHILKRLIELIEAEYPRPDYPDVFEALLAIHGAQEQSVRQLCGDRDASELLALSCAKGGTSVLADAYLGRGFLTEQEKEFAFQWGVLLQLGDDLQDIHDDLRRGSLTLFSRAARRGDTLETQVMQLLQFSEHVGGLMDQLPNGSTELKELLKMSWRSLIIRAVADSSEYFSPRFVGEAESYSPFRFRFLSERQSRMTAAHGLYANLFAAFVQSEREAPLEDLMQTTNYA